MAIGQRGDVDAVVLEDLLEVETPPDALFGKHAPWLEALIPSHVFVRTAHEETWREAFRNRGIPQEHLFSKGAADLDRLVLRLLEISENGLPELDPADPNYENIRAYRRDAGWLRELRPGAYVAYFAGEIVGRGSSSDEVYEEARAKCGPGPLLVTLAKSDPEMDAAASGGPRLAPFPA
ncbi:MAG: hypothetical protein AAB353_07505 [Candidatus Hydrogenedentota bacterium]